MWRCSIPVYFFKFMLLSLTARNFITIAKHQDVRKITVSHNPGCNISLCHQQNGTSTHIVYARAQGNHDSLHYIFSTIGSSPPTLLLLRSSDNSSYLKIDWPRLLSGSLGNINGAIRLQSTSGEEIDSQMQNVWVFNQILEYNDTNDEANIHAGLAFQPIDLKDFLWNVNIPHSANMSCMKGSTKNYPNTFSSNSTFSMNFSPFTMNGRSSELPRLPHNENSSDWTVILDNLLSRGTGSRFSLGVLMFGSRSTSSQQLIANVNDEYSPSVFTTEKLMWSTPSHDHSLIDTFSQWKAVSYTSPNHVRKYSTDVVSGNLNAVYSNSSQYQGVMKNRFLCAYFSPKSLHAMRISSMTVSFGRPDDGFYTATDYLSWTLSIGFGIAPKDNLSTLIICMLFAGIGCPTLVIICGGIYMVYLKMVRSRKRQNGYVAI